MHHRPLSLELDRSSHLPLPQQLVRALIQQIRSGALASGAPLPSSRVLAQQLGIHRNTVTVAFDELRAEGWVETERASHTRVTRTLPLHEVAPAKRSAHHLGFSVRPFENSARHFEAVKRQVLDFSGGLADARLFPSALLARAYRRALKTEAGQALDFGDPAGSRRLREQLSVMLTERRALQVGADQLMITRGSQFALHLLAIALIRPGDVVAVESPGYPSAREAFTLMGAKLLPIGVDGEGLKVTELAVALKKTPIRAVFVTPQCQDPTTVCLSARRRLQLLELAHRHHFAIIESDADHEFQFEGPPVLPLASSDPHGVVVCVGSLSKALAPGLRLGFVAAPTSLLQVLKAVRGQVDRQGDPVVENAVAELIDDGEVLRHALRARRIFQTRRDLLVSLLQKHFGSQLEFEVPRAGLALWVRVHEIDVETWAENALQRGVRFFTGRSYMPSGRTVPWLRLGYAHLNESELVEAVARMKRAL